MTELTNVRRKNRQVHDEEWIDDFLTRAATCVVGTRGEERVFLNPNLFVFNAEERIFYFHTAGTGRTRTNITHDQAVTVVVFEMGRLLPAPVVTDYSTEYSSVVIFGRARIVEDPEVKRWVLSAQMKKYFPHHEEGREYRRFTDAEAALTTVYRITIEEWSAKRNRAAEDHPGAYVYGTNPEQ